MNCLIIEDEPLAVNVLREYIEAVPELSLKAVCQDAINASDILRNQKIDLLFLDIHLPKINGLEFLKSLNTGYHVILTTAYHEYALEGFNLNVVDYLLKPIEFSRFLQAINKVFSLYPLDTQSGAKERAYKIFNVDKKKYKVFLDDIDYIESMKDYIKIHTSTQEIITKYQISVIESVLDPTMFKRIHKSYIVNLNKITASSGAVVEIGKISIPVGRKFKS
jgi:DNA-binding LytR/AlgR family response regulator